MNLPMWPLLKFVMLILRCVPRLLQLNIVRRNGILGKNLVRMLSDLYHDHGMSDHDFQLRHRVERNREDLPRIVCSEAFV